jgi:hypothetical protein
VTPADLTLWEQQVHPCCSHITFGAEAWLWAHTTCSMHVLIVVVMLQALSAS